MRLFSEGLAPLCVSDRRHAVQIWEQAVGAEFCVIALALAPWLVKVWVYCERDRSPGEYVYPRHLLAQHVLLDWLPVAWVQCEQQSLASPV